jgi:hypothetical protein
MRCLEREPHDRFASIVALGAALDRVVAACDAVHDEATAVRPAWDPFATVIDPAGDPPRRRASLVDGDRTWIDPDAGLPVDHEADHDDVDDQRATIRDPWHLPLAPSRTSSRTAPIAAQRCTACETGPGTTPPLGFRLAAHPTPPRTTPAYATLPAPYQPCARGSTPTLARPPTGELATAGVAWRAIGLALLVACITTLVLAVVLGAIS